MLNRINNKSLKLRFLITNMFKYYAIMMLMLHNFHYDIIMII